MNDSNNGYVLHSDRLGHSMLTDYKVTLQAQRPLKWPHFSGSRIRGAWGSALRKAACITDQPTCTNCPARSNCAYGLVFDAEPPINPVHPSFRNGLAVYVVQPPALGARHLERDETISFNIRLLKEVVSHHDLIALTIRRAIEDNLFNPGDCSLSGIDRHQVPTRFDEPLSLTKNKCTGIQITWFMPLRLQHNGKPIFRSDQLNIHVLISAAWRRYLQWCQITRQVPSEFTSLQEAAGQCTLDTQFMQWHDLSRYSSTQNKHLPLGGLLGRAHLNGPEAALLILLPLLRLGELLHVGKETVFGLGQYQLQISF